MTSVRLSSCASLSIAQKRILAKGGFANDLGEILLLPTQDVARRLRLTVHQVQELNEAVARDLAPKILPLGSSEEERRFSVGDERMDGLLGGGISTGQIYDICGEAASGKTQLALQLALFVQLPAPHGLSGSTAYITTSGQLPTSRLLQLLSSHALLQVLDPKDALDHIHTSDAKTPDMLVRALTSPLRKLAVSLKESTHPLRLIVVDSLAWVFRTTSEGGTSLFERAKVLSHIASLLRSFARDFNLAVVVVNHVSSVFDDRKPVALSQSSSTSSQNPSQPGEYTINYRDQSYWFASPGPGSGYEAALGLVWANEVNARVMLSRTRYRHYPEGRAAKRRRTMDSTGDDEEFARVRRMDVIFHPDAPPANLDYIITPAGLQSISDAELARRRKPETKLQHPSSDAAPDTSGISAEDMARYAEAMDSFAEEELSGEDEKGPDPDVTGVDEDALEGEG